MADTAQTVGREELYELVWAEPMLKVAAKFGVSSSYLARVCTLLHVPRPDRGYWAKLAAGKRLAAKPELPPPLSGDDTSWTVGTMPSVADTAPHEGSALSRLRAQRVGRRTRPDRPDPNGQHPLVRGVRQLFTVGRVSHDIEYLKPQKRLLPDIVVSLGCLDKALSFASRLYSALDSAGYRTVIASHGEVTRRAEIPLQEEKKRSDRHFDLWSPGRCTVAYVDGTPIGLTIFEMTEQVLMRYVGGKYVRDSEYVQPKRGRHAVDHTWTTTKDCGTTRLCVQAFSPYDSTAWVRQWREGKDHELSGQIPEIVKALKQGAVEVLAQHQAAMKERDEMFRRWDEEEARRKADEARRRAAAALKASKKGLHQVIAAWDEARRVKDFFAELERVTSQSNDPQDPRIRRIQLAKTLIGDSDPWRYLLEWKTPDEHLQTGTLDFD